MDVTQDINNIRNNARIYEEATDDYMLRKAKSYLFFDDNTRIEYLASQRFPNDNQAALKYTNIDGNLYYEDPVGQNVFHGKKYSKEFPDNEAVGWWGDTVAPNLVPAATFVADVGGGMAGAIRGFKKGQQLSKVIAHPVGKTAIILGSTAVGGALGTFGAGAVPRGSRELLISNFYSAQPAELSSAYYDLLESSAWGLIPFGTGTVGTARIVAKFKDRPDALEAILRLGDDVDVQKRIDVAKDFGIDLTPAQATKMGSRARDIQYFVTRQPDTRKIVEFYESQALQTEEAIRLLAERIGSGKTVGDINTRLKDAGEWVLDEITRRHKKRATRLYNILKEAPDGIKVDNMQGLIEIIDSKIAGEVLDKTGKVIRTMDPSPTTIKNLEKFKSMFYKDGILIDDLMSLDARRTSDVQKLIRSIQDTGGGDYGTIIGLTDTLTALMDESAPLYQQARRMWDPNKPAMLLLEKGVIGKFGKLMSDKQTATAMKNLFDPDVSIKSLRNARRVLEVADPNLFKDVKKQFILGKLDDFTRSSQLQKGLPRFKNYFQQPKVQEMMKEMLSPEEFATFTQLNGVMDDAFSIALSGSPTQPLAEMSKQFADEALGSGTKAAQNILNLNKLFHLLTSRGAGDLVFENVARKQQDQYLKNVVNALIESPEDYAQSLDEVYNFFNKGTFRNLQIFTRGTKEGVEAITEPSEQPYTGEERELAIQQREQERELAIQQREQERELAIQQREQERGPNIQDLLNQIEGIDPSAGASLDTVPVFEPESDLMPQELLSPTILPDERDREIAMRQQLGIAGLV